MLIVRRILHSVEEATLGNILKDLNLPFWIFVLLTPVDGNVPIWFSLFRSVYVVPFAVYWTPLIQTGLSVEDDRSPNTAFLWKLFLALFILPVVGAGVIGAILYCNYKNQSFQELLGYRQDKNVSNSDKSLNDNGSRVSSGSMTSTVKEYKRTCNECGETWHSLVGREKELKEQQCGEGCSECGNVLACNFAASAQETKNRKDTESEIENLKKCPECKSRNYDEEIIEYEK